MNNKLPFVFAATLIFLISVSCGDGDKQKEAEDREEAKVGKVYNPERQGIGQETRDNQLPSSRNDNREGTGLETGAPTDTTTVTETKP